MQFFDKYEYNYVCSLIQQSGPGNYLISLDFILLPGLSDCLYLLVSIKINDLYVIWSQRFAENKNMENRKITHSDEK